MSGKKCFDCINMNIRYFQGDNRVLNIESYCKNKDGLKTEFDGCACFSDTLDDLKILYTEFKKYNNIVGKKIEDKQNISGDTYEKYQKRNHSRIAK